MQTILITTSLVLVLTMLGSLWFAALRSRPVPEAVPVETVEDTV